jgi:hypothetical protein
MSVDLRKDEAHTLAYPTTPDSRGSVRIYHQRKAHYLGQHGSPLSYVMFGLWKQGLIEHGEPPASTVIRDQAEKLLRQTVSHRKVLIKRSLVVASITLACLMGAILGSTFSSTSRAIVVDGIPLSANENEIIRGIRQQKNLQVTQEQQQAVALGQQVAALLGGELSTDEIHKRIHGY